MRTRPLGRTEFEVSELSLGTWGLSGDGYGPVPEAEVSRVVDRAVELGITLFDTADVYGKGAMERLLGARLPRGTTFVVTKIGTDVESVPPRKRFDLEHLRPAFERSRERLGRDKLDVVLLHNPSLTAMLTSEPVDFLKELKRLGALGAWGVSAGDAQVARAALDQGADVVEIAYNALWATDLHEIAGVVAEGGAAVLARSVLAHGLLAGQWSAEREFYPGDHRADRWTPAELRARVGQLDALRPLVGGAVLSVRAAAVRFVLANQLVTSAVLGPRSVAQLDQLVREAGEGPPYLRDTALAELSARLRAAGVPDLMNDHDLTEVIRIGRLAADHVRAVYATPFTVELKGPNDPVTRADREANEMICAAIAASFPGDAILAEESVPEDPAEVRRLSARERVWFVDPLDGTREFADKVPEFAVMIGLAVRGRAALGVVVMPVTGEALAGCAGHDGGAPRVPAFVEDEQGRRRPLSVSAVSDPRAATLMVSRSHRPPMIDALMRRLAIARAVPCGSVGVKVSRLVLGQGDLYVHGGLGAKLWDTCAPEAILVAAGGRFSDLAGKPIDYASGDLMLRNGLVASNGALHEVVLTAVQAAP